ncbi:LLM class F420-dependent oxidoreductase [Mycobacteroides franklinii]|uniref:LLM class F420-dependent oxidoreductase n=1 Tax=Mycobacteroides franklinii TaxID=948102 RepID=UPI000992C186|nr:LLM class F420-dependent oxidoreductase [Mycobacteroides franklinii]
MELGVHFIDFRPGAPEQLGPTLAAAAIAAEEGGASMFTLADHYFQMELVGEATDPFLEGYTSMGFLAAQTKSIMLGMLVTGVTYRYPGLLAKIVTTLDLLSQGRVFLGLGAAWYEREHRALGVPYPPIAQRFEMLEETLQICGQMWSDDNGPYAGKHYQLAETICAPQPIERPPILIGGDGEKQTLRLVAQYADIWNSMSRDTLERKCDVLRRHCEDIGRDPATIRKTLAIGPGLDPLEDTDRFLRAAEHYADLGVEMLNITVRPDNPDPVGYIKRLGDEVIPKLWEVA